MDDIKETLDDMIEELRLERDKLKLKIGLARLEAADEWRQMEKKLAQLEMKAKEVGQATAEASRDVGAAARLLGDEIRKGLKTVAARLK